MDAEYEVGLSKRCGTPKALLSYPIFRPVSARTRWMPTHARAKRSHATPSPLDSTRWPRCCARPTVPDPAFHPPLAPVHCRAAATTGVSDAETTTWRTVCSMRFSYGTRTAPWPGSLARPGKTRPGIVRARAGKTRSHCAPTSMPRRRSSSVCPWPTGDDGGASHVHRRVSRPMERCGMATHKRPRIAMGHGSEHPWYEAPEPFVPGGAPLY